MNLEVSILLYQRDDDTWQVYDSLNLCDDVEAPDEQAAMAEAESMADMLRAEGYTVSLATSHNRMGRAYSGPRSSL